MKLIKREYIAMSIIVMAILGLFIAFWFLIMPDAQIVEAATTQSPPTTTTATTTPPGSTSSTALKSVTTATASNTTAPAVTTPTASTTTATPVAKTTTTTTTATITTTGNTTIPKVELSVSGLTSADAIVTDMQGNPVKPSDDLYTWLDFKINYNWSIPDGVQINSGDTVPFELPSGLAPPSDLTFPIFDSNNVKIGTATIKAGQSTGTITFNDALEHTSKNRHGTLQFIAKGTNTGSGNEGNNWMFNKNGWIAAYGLEGAPNELTWNIAFNPNSNTLTNVVITDTLGPNQEYIPGSLTAIAGHFENGNFVSDGYYLSPTVTTDGNKVIITFPDKITTSVDIFYRTKVTANPDGTNTWTNHATMGSSEGDYEVDSSTSWGGSGTGNGDQKTGSITLTKTDDVTGKALAGAVYELKDSTGKVITADATTDETGKLVISDLPYGTYTLTEVKAPDGYTLNPNPIEFTIPDNKVLDITAEQKDTAEKGAVILKKLDALTNATIAGATFNLLDKDGNIIKEGLVTDGSGQISVSDLTPGEYQFVETSPATGYIPDDTPILFTVLPNQTTPVELEKLNNELHSDSDTGSVVLTKFDATLKNTLPGAIYNLLDSQGNVLYENLTTDKNGQITVPQLVAGDYSFVEVAAPEGYEVNPDPIKFTVTKDMESKVQATDKQKPTEPGVTEPPTNPGPPTEPGKPKPPVNPGPPTEPGKPEPPVNPGPPTEPGKPEPPVNPGPTEPGKPKPPVTNPGPTEPSKPEPPVTNPGPTEPSKPSPNPGPSVVYPSTDNNNGGSTSVGKKPGANSGIGYGQAEFPQTGNENNLLMIISGFFIALFVLLKHLIKKLA